MRMLCFFPILVLSPGVASAADVYTQKPEVAPSIVRGETATEPPKKVDNSWPARFGKGPVPNWIWGPDQNKKYMLRKEFLNTGIKEARLRVTCDNRFTLYLNGKQIAASTEWQNPVELDVTKHLAERDNVLEAEVINDGGQAGFILQMVALKGEEELFIRTDASWTVSDKRNDPKGS